MKIIDASLVEIIDRCSELIDSAMSEAGLPNRRAVPDRSIYEILSEGTDSFGLIVEDQGKPIGFASVFVFTHQHSAKSSHRTMRFIWRRNIATHQSAAAWL